MPSSTSSVSRLIPVMALTLVLALSAAACSSAEPEWMSFDSPNGLFTVEVPGETTMQSEDVQGLQLQAWSVELGDDAYTVSEVTLPPGTPFDLDGGVQGSVDSMLASVESQTGDTGTAELTSTETTSVGEAEARSYTASLQVGDVEASVRGLTWVQQDVLVQLIAIDSESDNADVEQRFFDSLMPS